MLKNHIEARGYKIVVVGNSLEYYKDNVLVAETWGFTNKDCTKEHEGKIAFKLHKHTGCLKEYGWLLLEKEDFEELKNIMQNIRSSIEEYFNSLDNVKLEQLSNGSIILSEKPEQYNKLNELDRRYFYDIKEKWVANNKKYFIEDSGWNEDDFGMMHPYTNYFFTKENIEKIDREIEEYKNTEEYKEKQKKIEESKKRFNELCELAEKLTDEEFEDITGLPREHYLI